jgi:hypothetical protein
MSFVTSVLEKVWASIPQWSRLARCARTAQRAKAEFRGYPRVQPHPGSFVISEMAKPNFPTQYQNHYDGAYDGPDNP